MQYQGVFEAHITVEPLKVEDVSNFKEISTKFGVKTIEIALERGTHPIQPMTCSVHQGDFEQVKQEVFALAKAIQQEKFLVSRVKIEAHPNNTGIPQNKAELTEHSPQNYFEYHLKILLPQEKNEYLLEICAVHQAHLSNNAFKKIDSQFSEKFVTMRLYGLGKKEAQQQFFALKNDILKYELQILKEITEYCVYDTNVQLDANWLSLEESSPCQDCSEKCNFIV